MDDTSAQLEEEIPIVPIDKSLPLRRSGRVSQPPEFYRFPITSDGDTFIGDKKKLLNWDEAAWWKEAINNRIQSMYTNQVWPLVDHTFGLKTVGCIHIQI